jgi:hypothetical protein
MDPDKYLSYLFCEDYEEIQEFNEGWIETNFVDDTAGNEDGYIWDMVDFTPEQCKEIYHAIVADVKAGTVIKYNVQSRWLEEQKKSEEWKYSWEAYIRIQFKKPNEENKTEISLNENSYMYEGAYVDEVTETETWYAAHVTIGPDCENIINKLVEIGVIESAEDIKWGSN